MTHQIAIRRGAGGINSFFSAAARFALLLLLGVSCAFTQPAGASTLVFTDIPSSACAGSAFSVTVQNLQAGLPANVSQDTGVILSLATGTGTLSGTTSGTILAGQSAVTISGIIYSKAESGVSLTATPTGGDASTIDPGTSGMLGFVPRPTSVTSGNATICNGGSTTIQAALTGTGPWKITWSDGLIQNGVTTSPATRNVSPSANTTYTITALSDANCTSQASDRTGSAVVTVNARPTASISGSTTICSGGSANLRISVSGSGTISGTLSPGAIPFSGTAPTIIKSVSPTTTTAFSVASLSDANCSAQAGDLTGLPTVVVNKKSADPTSATASTLTICNGMTVTLFLSGGGGGTGESIHWYAGSCGGTPVGTGNGLNVSPASTTTYFGRYEDPAPCSFNTACASVTVTVNPRPTSFVSGSVAICNGSSTTIQAALTGTGPWNVTWSDGFSHSVSASPDTRTVSPSSATTYTVASLSDANCTALSADKTGSATVTVNARPTAVLSGSSTICNGQSASLTLSVTGSGTISGTLSDGSAFSGTAPTITTSVNPSTTTTYTIATLTDNNCSAQAGNLSGSATATVNNAPSFTACPANQTVNNDSAACTAVVNYTATASGTPKPTFTYAFSGDTTATGSGTGSGSTFNKGTTTVTITAHNTCSPDSTCSFTVTVNDNTPPTISKCPDPATVQCPSLVPAAATTRAEFEAQGGVVTDDNCSGTIIVTNSDSAPISDGCANRYHFTRTYTLSDPSGNSATCTQLITVNDTMPPSLTAGTIAACYKSLAAADEAAKAATSGTGGCGDALSFSVSDDGNTCPATITVTGTDSCGNSSSVTYTATILGSAPTFMGVPADSGYECLSSVPAPAAVSAADACSSPLTVIYGAMTNGTACAMTITRTWSATDCAGNPASMSQIISVTNDLPPNVQAGTLTTSCYKTLADAEAAAVAATTATANCGDAPTLTASAAGTCPTVITVSATDACGNQAAVTYNVTILGSAPTFMGVPADVSYECLSSVLAPAAVSAADACGSALTVSYGAVTNGTTCAMTITRTWSATDCAGNPASASQTIAVTNDLPPSVQAGTLATTCFKTLADAEAAAAAATTATANCGDAPTLTASAAGTCPTLITVTAADSCGNQAAVTYNVTILGSAPTFVGVPSDVSYECLSSVLAPAAVSAADACGSALAVSYGAVTNGTACAMIITRTWSATDCAGNPASASQTIAVTNDLPPSVQAGTLAATCSKTLADAEAAAVAATTATANCGNTPTLTASTAGTCPTAITVTATDACGNQAAVTYNVTILTSAPVFTGCPPATNYVCYSEVPPAATVTANDACGNALVVTATEVQSNPGSSCSNTITRMWMAADCAGNASACTQIITVNDDQHPSIACNGANPMAVAVNAAFVDPGATPSDNCTIVTVSTNGIVNTTVPGSYAVTYTATDACGNQMSITRSVNVTGTQYRPAGQSCYVNGVLSPGHVILQPVKADGSSVFKEGSTVPLKFMVFDANCNSVGTPGVVTGMTLTGTVRGTTNSEIETIASTTPDSSFRWDPTARQWIFNLSTRNLPANATFIYVINLNDGSNITFQFGLK